MIVFLTSSFQVFFEGQPGNMFVGWVAKISAEGRLIFFPGNRFMCLKVSGNGVEYDLIAFHKLRQSSFLLDRMFDFSILVCNGHQAAMKLPACPRSLDVRREVKNLLPLDLPRYRDLQAGEDIGHLANRKLGILALRFYQTKPLKHFLELVPL